MAIEITVPPAGESILSGTIGAWNKKNGDWVEKDEELVSIETDKVANELAAEASGILEIIAEEGEEVEIGALIGKIDDKAQKSSESKTIVSEKNEPKPEAEKEKSAKSPEKAPAKPPAKATTKETAKNEKGQAPKPAQLEKFPVDNFALNRDKKGVRKRMSPLRKKIASHLLGAQRTAAILTTYNEVDMSAVMDLRKRVQEQFVERYGVKLGFMSFFVKAVVSALKSVPQVNGMIDENEIVQYSHYDIGVAIGTERGLVVPVLRDCDLKSFSQIEQDIIDYAQKAKEAKISFDDLDGGVFTISNGGVYGSLLSSPIINFPQSAILGMHAIQKRAVVIDDEIKIKPMMYLALSYDHRLIDGKEAVTFLLNVKKSIESPARMLVGM